MEFTTEEKDDQRVTDQVSRVITASERKPVTVEGNGGKKIYNSIFRTFLKKIKQTSLMVYWQWSFEKNNRLLERYVIY